MRSHFYKHAALFTVCVIAIIPLRSYAADFDCGGKKTFSEIFICSDNELSELDSTVANAYRNLRASLTTADEKKSALNEQRQFLSQRNTICPVIPQSNFSDEETAKIVTCLKGVYTLRLNDIQKQMASIPADAPVSNTTNMHAYAPPAIAPQISTPSFVDNTPAPTASLPRETEPTAPASASSNSETPETTNEALPPLAAQPKEISSSAGQSEDDHSGVVALLIMAAILWYILRKLFGSRFITNICDSFRYGTRQNQIKKAYNRKFSDIGIFTSSEKFLTASRLYLKDRSLDTIYEMVPLKITMAKPISHTHADFTAMRGHFDAGAYNAAMNQWRIAKSQFEQQERLNNPGSINERKHYSVRTPHKGDFITYSMPANGTCSATVSHPYLCLSFLDRLELGSKGSIVLNAVKFEKHLLAIYKAALAQIANATIGSMLDAVSFPEASQEELYGKFAKEIYAKLYADAGNQLGSDYKELNVDIRTSNMENNAFELPIALVIASRGGFASLTFHDHLNPEIIIYSVKKTFLSQ